MKFDYTNWQGKTRTVEATPLGLTYFDEPGKVNEHLVNYPPGYFLIAKREDGQTRHYYLGLDPIPRMKNIEPGNDWPLMFGDLKAVESAVGDLAKKAANLEGTQTSPEIAKITAAMLNANNVELAKLVFGPKTKVKLSPKVADLLRSIAGSSVRNRRE